jgi:hypothetical protein
MSLLLCLAPTDGGDESERFPFVALAKEGRFHEIVHFLKHGDKAERKEWLRSTTNDHVESPLHVLLQYQPPLKAVSLLIKRMREEFPKSIPEAECDSLGRSSLHVACAFACNVAVVARLLNGATAQFRKPAAVQDTAHMTPLHWACQTASTLADRKDTDNMVQVIGFLVEAYPAAIKLPNKTGSTPADLLARGRQPVDPALLQALDRTPPPSPRPRRDESPDDCFRKDLSWVPKEICWAPRDEEDASMVSFALGGAAMKHSPRSKSTAPRTNNVPSHSSSEGIEVCSRGPADSVELADSSSWEWCAFESNHKKGKESPFRPKHQRTDVDMFTNSLTLDFTASPTPSIDKGKISVGSYGQVTASTYLDGSDTCDYDNMFELLDPMNSEQNQSVDELWA